MRIIRPILIGHFEASSDKNKGGFNPKATSIFKPASDVVPALQNDQAPSRHAIYSVDIQPSTCNSERNSFDRHTRLATCGGGIDL